MNLPFPVATTRFDQKNEMFKRSAWDEKMKPFGQRLYREAKYDRKAGFRQIDHAFRMASWNLETSAGFGNIRGNSGLYAWEGVAPRFKHWLDLGERAEGSPAEITRIVKRVARFFGADLVGVCRVHPNWVYSHEYNRMTQEHYPLELPEECRTAVVLAIAMDYDALRTSPSAIEAAATGLGYSQMVVVANLLAVFIRHLGYRALPSGNDTALNVPLAMAAGLGEAGRHGILITEKFGPRVRICKVFTDLPLVSDAFKPFGAAAFCRVCRKCAIHCPSRAIPFDGTGTVGHNISNHSGPEKWYCDYERCFQFWSKIRTDCANCIRVCPFNKRAGLIHDAVRWHIKKFPMLNSLIVKIDDLLGYGKQLPGDRYWSETAPR